MKAHILAVDDEQDILDLISYNLSKEGFMVSTAKSGEAVLEMTTKDSFDLIVLDLMLPGLQGTELCSILKKDPRTASLPIIMLTARSQEIDKVVGLEIGADDYMTKPFSPRELIARVNAVLRRTQQPSPKEPVICAGAIKINTETYQVLKNDQPIQLSATEFRLLRYLAERKGRIFDRNMLLDAVWKDEAYVEPRTVDVHIRRLRAQIEDDPSHPRYIKTRRGIGYYMSEDL